MEADAISRADEKGDVPDALHVVHNDAEETNGTQTAWCAPTERKRYTAGSPGQPLRGSVYQTAW
eukprot:546684-Prymnesium_polylepis.1